MDQIEEMAAKVARLAGLTRRERYGERLARARKALGVSQRDVAARLDVPQAAIARAETGHESPEELLVALEAFYHAETPMEDGKPFKVSYPDAPRDPIRRIAFFGGPEVAAEIVAKESRVPA